MCKTCWSIVSYSFFNSVAGLVRAARRVCQKTESRAMANPPELWGRPLLLEDKDFCVAEIVVG